MLEPRPTGLMQGYQGDDGGVQRIAMLLYRTGDVASVDDDGYLTYVGRADDVFKSSDYRISPFELESVLIEHPAVAEAAVVPSPDPMRLAVPKAFLALASGHAPDRATALSIFRHCRTALAPFKRVRRIEFAELPKTISGKIRRVELRRAEAANRRSDKRAALEFWEDDFSDDRNGPAELRRSGDRARQTPPHHGVQADAGLSRDLRPVRGVAARLFRAQYAPAHHRADHHDRHRRDQRAVRAIYPGRHQAAGDRRRPAFAAAGIEPLSGDDADRRGACRQCRLAGARRARPSRLARNQLSPARGAGGQRPSRAWSRSCNCPAAFTFWSGAISRSASGCSASSPMPDTGRWRWSSCSGLPAASSSAGACSTASTP